VVAGLVRHKLNHAQKLFVGVLKTAVCGLDIAFSPCRDAARELCVREQLKAARIVRHSLGQPGEDRLGAE